MSQCVASGTGVVPSIYPSITLRQGHLVIFFFTAGTHSRRHLPRTVASSDGGQRHPAGRPACTGSFLAQGDATAADAAAAVHTTL